MSQQNAPIKDRREASAGFPPAAYQFVREGLDHTTSVLHGDADPLNDNESRHVSGQQLCLGLRDYALRQFGSMAGLVLRTWNVRRTEDFGRIVFDMVEAGVLRKTEDDTIEDFANVYDFEEAFASPHAGGSARRTR